MFDGLVFTLTFQLFTLPFIQTGKFLILCLHLNNEATWIFIKCYGSGVDYVRKIFHMKKETAY